jgi:predicted nucleic acid-binding protein
MYFLGGVRGWQSQAILWRLVERGALLLHNPHADEWERVRELMEQYRDTPMDLADASLVALAEHSGVRQILTLDSDFRVYRIHRKEMFEVIALPVL